MGKYNYWRKGQKKLTKLPKHCEVLYTYNGKWQDEHGDPQEWDTLTRRWPRPPVKAKPKAKPKTKAKNKAKYTYWYSTVKRPDYLPERCEFLSIRGDWHAENQPPSTWMALTRRWPKHMAKVKAVRPTPAKVKAAPPSLDQEATRLLVKLTQCMVHKPDGWFSATRTGYMPLTKKDCNSLKKWMKTWQKQNKQ